MDVIENIKLNIKTSLAKVGFNVELDDIVIERSKDASHGDYATNVAMKYAKALQKNPRDLANLIIENLDKSNFIKIEIAGPGFVNFFVKKRFITKNNKRNR